MQVGYMPVGLGPMAEPETIVMAAGLAEEAGFHSIWASDHVILVDTHERSSYPYSPDRTFPTAAAQFDMLDPFVTLAFVAAHTRTIRIGTGICLVPERNPVITAKEVASLDRLSGGRLDFGIGIGWLREEFDALGVPWERRAARTTDYLAAMRALWSQDCVDYEGEFCAFSGVRSYPKPVQRPHPPIICGGESEAALRRAADLGDGWYGMNVSVEAARACIHKVSEYAKAAGRAKELHFSINPGMGQRISRDEMEELRDVGVDQIIMGSFAASAQEVREEIERLAADVVSVAGELGDR